MLLRFSRLVVACLSIVVLASAGCNKGPRLVKVSGIVTIDGKPLEFGNIQVAPKDFRPAYAKIGPDGKFTLTTFENDDGTVDGEHLVAVAANEAIKGNAQKWHAPKKFADITSSNLKMTVNGPTDKIEIKLSWEGGAPFIEYFGKE